MKDVFIAFVKQDKDAYLVYVPTINAMTQGTSFFDSIVMARDLLGTYSLLKELPPSLDLFQSINIAIEKVDTDDFKFSEGTVVYVDIDTDEYKNKLSKKNIDIHSEYKNKNIPEPEIDFLHSYNTEISATEKDLEEFQNQGGCDYCGSQRCLGDLEGAEHCGYFVKWYKTKYNK